MMALPGQRFYIKQIPVSLWFLAKKEGARASRPQTRASHDPVHRELTDTDLQKITSTYHAWRGIGFQPVIKKKDRQDAYPTYTDIPGFCFSATKEQIASHGHVLTPGRYVGAEEIEDDDEPFEDKMTRLVNELHSRFAESAKLETQIRANLKGLGFKA